MTPKVFNICLCFLLLLRHRKACINPSGRAGFTRRGDLCMYQGKVVFPYFHKKIWSFYLQLVAKIEIFFSRRKMCVSKIKVCISRREALKHGASKVWGSWRFPKVPYGGRLGRQKYITYNKMNNNSKNFRRQDCC